MRCAPKRKPSLRLRKILRPNLMFQHLHHAGESYWQHLRVCLWVAGQLLLGAFTVVLHGLCPAIFPRATSERIVMLADKLELRRDRVRRHEHE